MPLERIAKRRFGIIMEYGFMEGEETLIDTSSSSSHTVIHITY
jgi:hypothetical protein